ADKPRKAKMAGFRCGNERHRQARLAASRCAANEHRKVSGQHRRCVHARGFGRHYIAGSLTKKRAPITLGALLAPRQTDSRFSTQMRPSCASTICFEIESPSPEFWPNA